MLASIRHVQVWVHDAEILAKDCRYHMHKSCCAIKGHCSEVGSGTMKPVTEQSIQLRLQCQYET